MQNDTPPLLLTFGASDPTGTTGIQADLATFASFGCHGLSVITQLNVEDTVRRDGALPVEPEWVADQARTVLEDIPVAAFKVGTVGSTENVMAIAEIVADYPDVALILAPAREELGDGSLADLELAAAIADLLIAQTSLLVVREDLLEPLAGDGGDASDSGDDDDRDPQQKTLRAVARLLDAGCEYLLVMDGAAATHRGEVTHTLYGSDDAGAVVLLRQDRWTRLPQTFRGKTDTLASAVAALLANGVDIPEAVGDAQQYLQQTLDAGLRLGMGRLMPDRLFWTRGDENETQNETPGDADASDAGGADAGGGASPTSH